MKEIHLSQFCWKLWVAVSWFTFLITAILLIIFGIVLSVWKVIAIIIAALLVALLLVLLYMRAYWKRFRFTYDNNDLRVYSGIWWQKQILIPLGRITNVNIMQGPWQRSRKLATLKIETAGQSGTTSPETQLWSQTDYEALRDEILEMVVSARGRDIGDGTSAEPTQNELKTDGETHWTKMIDLLEKIEKNTRGDR